LKIEDSSLHCEWQPIETYEKTIVGTTLQWQQVIVSHIDKQWIRFGFKYPGLNRWYYSATNERTQYAQVEGDAPTHWMPMMNGPWKGMTS
jgi:hypothetical protein